MKKLRQWLRKKKKPMTALEAQVSALLRQKRWHRLFTALAAVVMFYTTYALILPALTMESDTAAGMFGQLPWETGEEGRLHSHTAPDGRQYEVLFTRTEIPEDAILTPTELTPVAEGYEDMRQQVLAQLDTEPASITLVDISFYDSYGEYIPVSDTAQVTLDYSAESTDSQIRVFHFGSEGLVELENVALTQLATADAEGEAQSRLTFETEGFSIFAVVEYDELVDLSGDYYIYCRNNTCGMECSINSNNALDISQNAQGSVWTLTRVTGNTYTLRSDGSYVVMSDGSMSLTTDASSATAFTVDAFGEGYRFGAGGYYINEYGGCVNVDANANIQGFKGYNVSGDEGNRLYLRPADEDQVTGNSLDGKSFALVSMAYSKALTTTTATVNGVSGLASQDVTVTTVEGMNCVIGDIPLWTFTYAGTADTYYVSTMVNDTVCYLTLLEEDYDSSDPDGRGSLTLVSTTTPQAITVVDVGDGNVYLTCQKTYSSTNDDGETTETTVTGYINKDGSGSGDFWVFKAADPNDKLMLCQLTDYTDQFTVSYTEDETTCSFTVKLVDSQGNPLYVTEDYAQALTDSLRFADIAPEIQDYTMDHVQITTSDGTATVVSVSAYDGTEGSFRFFEEDESNFYTRGSGVTVTMVYRHSTLTLLYDLNAPSVSWRNSPSLAQTTQTVTEDGAAVYTVAGGNAVGYFISNVPSSRGEVVSFYDDRNAALDGEGLLTQESFLAPGRDYRFLGWTATVDGEECWFAQDAQISVVDEQLCIVDMDGVSRYLSTDTTLTGQWDWESELVLFFVNFGDTMLENEDMNPIAGYGSNYYTGIVAIGHIYNPTTISPTKNDDNQDCIDRDNDALIQSEIVADYDPDTAGTQIVIDAVAVYNGSGYSFEAVSNYNEALLEEAVSGYLKNNTSNDTQVKIDNAYVDKTEITSENYKLYWYLQKEESGDAWHIDGVLVAKTYAMEIYKTFSGLTQTQVEGGMDDDGITWDGVINAMQFPLYLIHTENSVDTLDAYTTLTANSEAAGVYTNDGRQGTSNIYKWTLQSIQGQRYAFEETGYELDGYDCSSLVSVHYTDGSVIYKYNTTSTFVDEDLFAEKPLEGGEVDSIIFANFYTRTGTGAFSVSKVESGNTANRLPGAVFTLESNDDRDEPYSMTLTTNENGAVQFSDLAQGTYILKETSAPDGYRDVETTWAVEVVVEGDETDPDVYVYIDGTLYYDRKGTEQTNTDGRAGVLGVFQVENTPADTTLTVTKYFSITTAELAELKDSYYIELLNASGTQIAQLELDDYYAITGQVAYTWTLTGITSGEYTLVEHNHTHTSYLDTVVSVNGSQGTEPSVAVSDGTIVISLTKTGEADSLAINNTYTNEFQTALIKVDATDSTRLSGAKFTLYTLEHSLATGTGTYTYTDSTGTHTAYYVGQVTTGEDGTATLSGLKLSGASASYTYVLVEDTAPPGHVRTDEPWVFAVSTSSVSYVNGVYTLTAENTPTAQATVTVTADVQWEVPTGFSGYPGVTLYLYRQAGADGDVEQVGSVTLTAENYTTAWADLPYQDSAGNVYDYYVSQLPLDGFSTRYSTPVSTLSEAVTAAIAQGTDTNRQVTVTNATGYELPAAGGMGTRHLAAMGTLLTLLSFGLAIKRRKRA